MRKLILLLALFSLCLASQASVRYVYVGATTASDSNNGLTTNTAYADFAPLNFGGAHTPVAGDVIYVLTTNADGSILNPGNSTALCIRNFGPSGTSGSPIIFSNYPGMYISLNGVGNQTANNDLLDIRGSSWLNIYGINVTNNYRVASFQSVTNCEIAYCDFGWSLLPPSISVAALQPFIMSISSQSNWVHNCTVHDAQAGQFSDSTHCMTFGTFVSSTDYTEGNIIESNICFHAGHDTLSVYGPYNLMRQNFVRNENWFFPV